MPDLFISYSRRNLEFVHALAKALAENGKPPWFDQIKQPLEGIPPGSKWWEEITYGIENADNFLFIASLQSITSPYCHAEIAHARQHAKRIVPVLYCGEHGEGDSWKAIDEAIETIGDDSQLPNSVTTATLNLKTLVRENWLDINAVQFVIFSDTIPFMQSYAQLVQALDLDLAWIKMHSQLRQAAQLWVNNNRSDGYLWSAERLKPVYEMLERRTQEDLDTTVREFIQPEQKRLLAELEDINTSHQRRSAIGERLAYIGDPRPGVGLREDGLPDIVWCPVPSGEIMFTGKVGYGRETKTRQFQFQVHPFYTAKYPITYVQFQAFLDDKEMGFERDEWWKDLRPQDQEPVHGRRYTNPKEDMGEQSYKYGNYPRENISWYHAVAFCRWLTVRLPRDAWPSGEVGVGDDWMIRLPTEYEWQQAATGGRKDYLYPWGKEWDQRRVNAGKNGIGRTTAVGMYPGGASPAPTLALDMAGNIQEWSLNEGEKPENVNIGGYAARVIRSSSYSSRYSPSFPLDVTYREQTHPSSRPYNCGFRVVVGTIPEGSGV
jgi:formylglycine-generating enzyme required for sulfatase activity